MASKFNTTSDWLSASGTRIEGVYELREFVRADECSAIFRTFLPNDLAPRGLARLFRLDAKTAARQKDLWQALARISHQNLRRIFSASVTEIDAEVVAYVITDGADETLAMELQERRLTAGEAGRLLLNLVPALNDLHTAGFVHGRVCPAEMFPSGDAIKISADCATWADEKSIAYCGLPTYVAPEQSENTTPAADIWCFGASLFEALTQTPFTKARLEEARRLPAPFGRIIVDCVDPDPGARPRLAEILSLYQRSDIAQSQRVVAPTQVSNVPRPVAYAMPPVSKPDAVPEIKPEPKPAVEPDVKPVIKPADTFIKAPAPAPLKTTKRSPFVPLMVGMLLLLVVLSLWLMRSKTPDKARVTSPAANAVARQIGPDPEPVPAPAPVSSPLPAVKQSAPADQPSSYAVVTKAEPTTTKSSIWRVVLWTYRKRADAQTKADSLAARFPALHPEVFTPDTNKGGLYLVVAGGEMTRKQAEETQRSARQAGLPRDTYIQNFSH